MYCKSAFTLPFNFYINIYDINFSKKFMKIALFQSNNVGRSLKVF